MPITVVCDCGRKLKANQRFAGTRAECPSCGAQLLIPVSDPNDETGPSKQEKIDEFLKGSQASKPRRESQTTVPPHPEPMEIVDFLDPPSAQPVAAEVIEEEESVLKRMLDALLDPRATQWLLMIGGGLFVLGMIIWLVSIGVFDNPMTMAIALGLGSVAVLMGGWYTTLRTKYTTAGHAITFLGCVVVPLNLWFYHAQNLITLEDHLWIGGLVCVACYVATVFLLRSPLFMYAVEAGVTLTVLLLMADLGQMNGPADFCFWLMGLAVVSILAERCFATEGEFSRRRYGLPLFWSGQAQLATSLSILLISQCADWLTEPLGLSFTGNILTEEKLLATGLWVVGAGLLVYSDIFVRHLRIYSSLAAFCALMAFVTGVMPHLTQETFIALSAIVALVVHVGGRKLAGDNEQYQRHITTLTAVLSAVPLLLGSILHARATSRLADVVGLAYETGWWFVIAMLVIAITNRVSAYLSRDEDTKLSATFFIFSAGGAIIATAGLLRQVGWVDWSQQAPLLMLIPIAYLVASRLYRGRYAERPLQIVAHVATVVILFGVFWAALERDPAALFVSITGATQNLLLGVAFVEATLFYVLAGLWQKRGGNVVCATATGCAAIWQFLGYFGLATVWYPLMFAAIGLGLLFVARFLGLELVNRFQSDGEITPKLRGRGLIAFQCGNGVLTVALIAAFMKGLGQLGSTSLDWLELFALILTALAAGVAIVIVPAKTGWRQWYSTAACALVGVIILTLNILVDLTGWQKVELFCVTSGVLLLVVSTINRFRESDAFSDDSVSMGLAIGSLLAVMPLFIAMGWHRSAGGGPSFWDEIALLTISVIMLVTGLSWQMKAPTLLGGVALVLYLMILIGSIAYRPQAHIGIYMMAGAALIFGGGVLASIYRDRLLALPDQIAKREGLFRIINWR